MWCVLGMDTRRTLRPSAAALRTASAAMPTSEPVAITMASGGPRNRSARSRRAGWPPLAPAIARLMRHRLAREDQAGRSVAIARSPRPMRPPSRPRRRGATRPCAESARRLASVLDRLVRRAVLAESDRIVRVTRKSRASASAPPCAAHCGHSRRKSGTCRHTGMNPPCQAMPFSMADMPNSRTPKCR